MNVSGGRPFLGNTALARRLHAKVAEGRLAHGLIFSGPAGVGKRTFALHLGQALNCSNRTGGQACGQCNSCRKIVAGAHPDVTTISLQDDASQIKIEQIRRIRSQLDLSALEGDARVFLIDPAERMSPGAANALLKALEEPPEQTYLILITANAHELLLTIRSRCQLYHFAPLRLDEIRASGVDDELVARWSRGSMGLALSTDPERLREIRDALLEFMEIAANATDRDLAGLLGAGADLARSKDDYRERIRALGVLVSDLLYAKEGIEDRIVNIDEVDRIRQIAAGIDMSRIVQIGDCIRFIESALRHHVNQQMLTDTLALTLNSETSQILNDKPFQHR